MNNSFGHNSNLTHWPAHFGSDLGVRSLNAMIDEARANCSRNQSDFCWSASNEAKRTQEFDSDYPYSIKRTINEQLRMNPQSNVTFTDSANMQKSSRNTSDGDSEDSNSKFEPSGNEEFIDKFIRYKEKQRRQERVNERKRRKKELKSIRRELQMSETVQFIASPPSLLVSVTPNIPRLTESASVVNSKASPLNIEKKLDFSGSTLRFRNVSELLPPQPYLLKSGLESKFIFSLSSKAVQLLIEDNADTQGYRYGVLLRISQFLDKTYVYYDSIPTSLQVTVNSEPLHIDEMLAPIDISELVKPLNQIKLLSRNGTNMNIVLGVFFVQFLTVEKALSDYKVEFHWRSWRREKGARAKMSANNSESVRLSLKCPLSGKRMKIPCVGSDCAHYECFDLKSYVKLHHQKFQWKCPLCDKWMRNVVRDRLFSEIIDNVSPSCVDVVYYNNDDRLVELTHEDQLQPFESTSFAVEDRLSSSIIEEIYIERI